jgi:hypothetical protein
MMNGLFYAHSGLRYLILLMGVVCFIIFTLGLVQKRAFGKGDRIVGTIYAGLLHTQVTLGLIMVAMGRFYPALIGHLVLMLMAAVEMQVLMIMNRKREVPGFVFPLAGVVGSLVMIAVGVMAIGRGLFATTAFAP